MNVRTTLFLCGLVLMLFGLSMFAPLIVNFMYDKRETLAFVYSSFVTIFSGALLTFAFYSDEKKLKPKDMFLFTTLSWILVCSYAALPFYFSTLNISYTNAFFETMSGLTTTGSTVLSGLDYMPRGILFWRSLLQWIGGIGIIVLAIAILPVLQIGGMQLFSTESSDNSDKALPKAKEVVIATVFIYTILTTLCAIFYYVAGMGFYDALTHAMTTLPSGGYSNYDASLGHFKSPFIQWVAVIFMTISATPLIFYYHVYKLDYTTIKKDTQIPTFLIALLTVIGTLSFWLWAKNGFVDNFEPFVRRVAVNVASVVSTTGYASEDYNLWGHFSIAIFLFLLPCGGCTGSTAGGIKMFRFGILYITIKKHIKQMISPHMVYIPKYNDKVVTDDVIYGVLVFIAIFILSTGFFTIALCLSGVDVLTALSGWFTCFANTGPGAGDIIGPAGNFASLPSASKWILSTAMLFGRLEFLTIMALFLPNAWKE
ncbi:MAG: Trk system potassium uptake protein TrkH [Alphaproteobacteria bacterium ADurb.Bin438]|nr:MAG: Trk system potassium uptake protein TrkH [Alphaproteobacteria bacterium ADurb.Bin438]